MKRVLITGALGYLGTALSTHLLRSMEDVQLLLLDRMDFESNRDFFYTLLKNPRVSFFKADIRNEVLMNALIKDCDAVVNLAALVGEPLCRQKPEETIAVNERAAKSIGDICARKGKLLINASTCSNYGISPTPATEASPLYPESLYAITKCKAEEYLLENCPKAILIRCATAFGVSPRTRMDLILNEWVLDAMKRGEITIFSPEVHRPIVHVYDIAEAIRLLIENHGHYESRIFNVGSNVDNYTKGQIAEAIGSHLNVPVKIIDKIDPRDYIVDFTRISRELGFKTKYSIEDGIREIKEAIETKQIKDEDILNNRNVVLSKH